MNAFLAKASVIFLLTSAIPLHADSNRGLSYEFADDLTSELETLAPVDSNSENSCSMGTMVKQQRVIFECAARRLLNVNTWADLITIPGNKFVLRSAEGREVRRPAAKGDLIEIRLPGDPTRRSYWVKIEALTLTMNSRQQPSLSLKVRPSRSPLLTKEWGITDHFFTDAATNTFTIRQSGISLVASVNGRDEEANTTQARSRRDAIANQAIALGAWGLRRSGETVVGMQSMVWDSFTKSLATCEDIQKLCPELTR